MGIRMYGFTRWWLRQLVPMFFGVEVHDADRVPMDGPLIVACNHASYLDPPLIGLAMPRPVSFLARKTLFNNPVFGYLIREHFAFPLDRDGDPREALRVFGARLQEGCAVTMFPEGTRTHTGYLQPMKDGVGLMAVRNRATVQPMYIWGSYQSWPRAQKYPHLHRFKIYFGEPIVPVDTEDRKAKKEDQQRIRYQLEESLKALEVRAMEGEDPPTPLALPEPEADGVSDADTTQASSASESS